MKVIYLIVAAGLIASCVEKKSSGTEYITSEVADHVRKDTLSFTSGVGAIFQDSKGNYWFGSHREGVGFYDGNGFEYFTEKDGLSHNQVRTIQEDKDGIIWFGTAKGVCSYNRSEITYHTPVLTSDSESQWLNSDGDLWFDAGNQAGVYRYDGQRLRFLAFPSPKVINPDNVYFVTDISEGMTDMLWIGTYAGAFGFRDGEFTVINDETLGLSNETGMLHIRSVMEDSEGRLWIGNNGIGVLLKDGDGIINFSESHGLIHPTSTGMGDPSKAGTLEHVFVIEEDSDGNIWFADRDTGAWRYDGEAMTNYAMDDSLKSAMIWDIYEDQDENLLFALSNGSVYRFNGVSFDRWF